MKSFVVRPIGLVGVLLMLGGCGSSGAGGGSPDASVDDSSTPGPDAPVTIPDASGSDVSDVTAPPTPEAGPGCGNGVVEGSEECDDGSKNGSPTDGCTNSCTFVCVKGDPARGDAACNTSSNPCLGTATCQADHSCKPGTPLGNGASCGTGKICNGGLCAQAVCGDGIVTAPEECDDGGSNGGPTDGCTQTCTFVCVSTDPKRNCTPLDLCAGKGTCDDTKHTCTPGTPAGNGTICGGEAVDGGAPDGGPIDVCKGGTCVPGYCGDGVLEPGEQCDFGTGNGPTTGCKTDCTFSCTKNPDSCFTADLCAGTNTCTTVVVTGDTGQKCVTGAQPPDGTPCAAGGKCLGGVCKPAATCGNGVLDPGEQCDFGAGKNLAGSGCEPTCQFSCQKTPTDTCQTNTCAANPTLCTTVPAVTGSTAGQKCQSTTQLAACGDCSASGVCVGNNCATSHCGDGCVDPRIGETCEPPGSATCDASCHTIAAAVCGNGIREATEQCDDGNKVNLDGCDYPKCQFEQEHRATSVAIATTTDTFCGHNALGNKALTGLAVGNLNTSLTAAVKAGTTTIEFKFLGIKDLSGTTQASGLTLGALSGAPQDVVDGGAYDGTNDLDWWYATAATTIDSNRNPLSLLPATFAAKVLKASGTLDLNVIIGGPPPANLHLSGANVQTNVGGVSTPLTSTGTPPGHLAAEHLDPALQSFATMNNGLLCGNISAASLATVPVPAVLLSGATACSSPVYTASNSLLDVLVNGCTVIVFPAVNATQPDQTDPAFVPAGNTGPYTLASDPTTHKVNTCTPASGTAPAFADCLKAAAYSSYFNFASDRVINK